MNQMKNTGLRQDDPVDFVLPWVDGSDPEWQKERARYTENDASSDNRDSRYRDWGLLKYWFRGVEQFAPWVNRIFFVTCGQIPEWMDLSAPKLVPVNHADYIPKEYLPTFSSHAIELNLHRIEELTERFVYFNDDIFLLKPVSPDYFFRGGLPVFPNELQPIIPRRGALGMANIYLNDTSIINNHFTAAETYRDQKRWFSLRTHSKKAVFYNMLFSRYYSNYGFIGFRNPHFAVPTIKSTMREVWEKEPAILDETCRRKFRDPRDVNQMVFRYWQYATNQFEPEKLTDIGKYYVIRGYNTDKLCTRIRQQAYPQVCLNDMDLVSDEEALQEIQNKLISAFETLLPRKSSFEK